MDNSEQKIEMEKCAEEIIENKNGNAELGKEEMSSSMAKNVSDEMERAPNKKAKKSLKFGGWLPDCLDWFKRPELAQSALPTSSYTMNRYCWPHLHGRKVKPHTIRPRLTFTREKDNEGNERSILKIGRHILFPITEIDLPEYITGFGEIKFEFIDENVLQFMEKIYPLLKEIQIDFRSYQSHLETTPIKRLMELLAPKASKLKTYTTSFDTFDEKFPDIIFGIQSIYYTPYFLMETDQDLIMKWLQTPMQDSKPKMLEIIFDDDNSLVDMLVDRVKEEFCQSTEPANFTILITAYQNDVVEMEYYEMDEFKIENDVTGEMLELKKHKEFYTYSLFRYQKDKEKIDELEQKANSTIVTINLK